jgi:hypothetical protein
VFAELADYAARKGTAPVYPHIVLRGHMHRYASGEAHGIRAIGAPAWQLATSFVNRISQTTLSDIGGLLILCADGEYEVTKVLYTPDQGTTVTV